MIVVDIQEKLLPPIFQKEQLVRNSQLLIRLAGVLNIPALMTVQYPKGLGPTVPELARRLPQRPDKVAFSCCAIPSVVDNFRRAARPKLLLAGIETHVCVQQTALDLLALNFRVYIPADGVASRHVIDHAMALRRLENAGAIVTTCESAVFEWIGAAGTPQFKEISRLVQERMKHIEDRR